MNKFDPVFSAAGRTMMALIFVLAGLSKMSTIGGTQGYMESVGLSGILIYPTILFEVVAGLAIIVGFKTRYVALALAAFSLLSALIFHNQLGDQMQFILFMKIVAMAGGFLVLARYGAGELSLDHWRSAAVASRR